MLLPLVDGIFAALVLAGALDSVVGIVQVGLLVFGGSATVAVILAELESDRRRKLRSVLAVGAVLVAVAAVEAAVAPTIQSLLNLVVFERFAGLVILAIAAKTASARIGEYLPRPAVIIGLGMVASVQPANAQLLATVDPGLVARAVGAALVGTGFALAVVLLEPHLRGVLDIDRFRFGSAVALGTLAIAVLGLAPESSPAPLAVLGVAALLAFDPGGQPTDALPEPVVDAATDGGDEPTTSADGEPRGESGSEPIQEADGDLRGRSVGDTERAPWL